MSVENRAQIAAFGASIKVSERVMDRYENAKGDLAEELAFSVCRAMGYGAQDQDLLRDRPDYERLCEAIERLIL